MNFQYRLLIFFICLLCSVHTFGQKKTDAVQIVIHTELGDIQAVLFTKQAPLTSNNFLRYIEAGAYNDGLFYRTVTPNNQPNNKIRIEVIQGGVDPAKTDTSGMIAIPLERTSKTGVLHTDGTLSMARDAPDTATTEFFICIGDQPSLDFGGKRNSDGQGFAAFGRVTQGMDIVRKIQAAKVVGQNLTPAIKILKITRK